MVDEELHYKILKALDENPELSQRDLAGKIDLSLGKVNYCLKALMEKGWIKARNFKNSRNKLAYFYILTPSGLEGKAKLTASFLQRKMNEYDVLRLEIEKLKSEMSNATVKNI